MMVRVIGIGRAFSMDLEDVFVRAEVKYHTRHRALRLILALASDLSRYSNIQSDDKRLVLEVPPPVLARWRLRCRCVCGLSR